MEVWRPVVGYEGLYEVSNFGNVRALERTIIRSNGRPHPWPAQDIKAHLSRRGYPYVRFKGKNHYVSRLVCRAFNGEAPSGKNLVLHNDDNPNNNTPSNLRWGDHQDNMDDVALRGRHHNTKKTHCPRGHEYSAENTYDWSGGHRECKECGYEKRRRGLPSGDPRHGTLRGYAHWGCRCEECKRAKADYTKGRK